MRAMRTLKRRLAVFTALTVMLTMMMTGGLASSANLTEPIYSVEDLFTERDLEQTADRTDAEVLTVSDGEDIRITESGVYVLTGTAAGVTVYVEADGEDKVQLVLDGLNLTNTDFPCIYIKEADKVFITLEGENSLTVTGAFRMDGDTNTDGVIFSKEDLVLNGTGSLNVSSTDHGIVCKDDLKITGGTCTVRAAGKAVEANDSIRIADGILNLTAGTDGLHAENGEDDKLGYIYISGGSITIQAGDDGIHGTSVVQIDGGEVTVSAAEGIEGTCIQINGGTIRVTASDDGINAASKSGAYTAAIIINGGETTVSVGAGDTDGVDSNGNLYMNGGTLDVTGSSTFDYDGIAEYNGGTITANGQRVTTIPNQMMGGMNMGGGWNNGGWNNGGWNNGGWNNSSWGGGWSAGGPGR